MKQVKKNLFFKCFIFINLMFILLQIHKQSYLIKYFYEKQNLQKEKDQMLNKKNYLMQQIYEMKNPSKIMDFAQEKLNLQKTKLNQIKKIKFYE